MLLQASDGCGRPSRLSAVTRWACCCAGWLLLLVCVLCWVAAGVACWSADGEFRRGGMRSPQPELCVATCRAAGLFKALPRRGHLPSPPLLLPPDGTSIPDGGPPAASVAGSCRACCARSVDACLRRGAADVATRQQPTRWGAHAAPAPPSAAAPCGCALMPLLLAAHGHPCDSPLPLAGHGFCHPLPPGLHCCRCGRHVSVVVGLLGCCPDCPRWCLP